MTAAAADLRSTTNYGGRIIADERRGALAAINVLIHADGPTTYVTARRVARMTVKRVVAPPRSSLTYIRRSAAVGAATINSE